MKPQAFIFMGPPGSGKGTQAQLLLKTLAEKDPGRKVLRIETGAEFRKFMQGDGYTNKLAKNIIEKGWLMPEFMPIYLWAKELVEKFGPDQHLLVDGTPRRLHEAQIVESVFGFYGLGKPWVIYLDAHVVETTKRLLKRASIENRKDDSPETIKRRHEVHEDEVGPTIEYYRKDPGVNFLDIDGIGTIEEVHNRIVKALGF